MQRPPVLPDTEIQRRLAVLPGWERQGNALRRTFTFRGFPEAVEFIRSMVGPAETLQHHPDVDLRYDRVLVSLSTPDQGGITALDFDLAARLGP